METKTMNHTPIPWALDEYLLKESIAVINPKENTLKYSCIASVHKTARAKDEAEANAAFIVTACNAHDDLIEACKMAYEKHGHQYLFDALSKAGVKI